MIKKVKSADLKVGMFVHDINVPWLEHSFARNRFLIRNEKEIEKILAINKLDVLIDTSRGADATDAPTLQESEIALMGKLLDIASEPAEEPLGNNGEQSTHQMDFLWQESSHVRKEAIEVVGNILADARIGKQIDAKQAGAVVSSITDSVLSNDGTLVSLCRLKQRDKYTFQHSVSISALLVTFCHAMGGFSKDDLHDIGLGGLFHDIGKMKIPDEILNKPGSLTDHEYSIMMTHVQEGISYLGESRILSQPVMKIVAEHHERFDGTGYPRGIARNAISLLGQMASIVDVYDAITSVRVYHSAIEPVTALQRIYEWGGKHFDETLVHSFIKGVGIYPVGSLVHMDSGRLAIVVRQGVESLLKPIVRVVFDTKAMQKLSPRDINLAAPSCQDHISGYEIPENWGIDPFFYLGHAV